MTEWQGKLVWRWVPRKRARKPPWKVRQLVWRWFPITPPASAPDQMTNEAERADPCLPRAKP
jgi:hypothetical protein